MKGADQMLEQPKEPNFYPDNLKPVTPEIYDTLQNIASTLERIEKILFLMERNQLAESSERLRERHEIIQTFA